MRLAILSALVVQLVALATGVQSAEAQQQRVPPAPRISLEEAKTAVDAAEAEARRNGWNLVFIVADAEGTPIYLRRMDGVPTRNYEVAMTKNRTALASGMHTDDYGPALQAGRVPEVEGGVTYAGGLLLRRGGELLGAFSASGARGEEDSVAVRAGMAAIGIQP